MRTLLTVNVKADRHWPSGKEIENRNAAIRELSDRNLGKFMKAGSVRGGMHFSYEVHDVKAARAMIAKAMFNHLPGWNYSIEAKELSMAKEFQAANDTGRKPTAPQTGRQQGMDMGR